MCVKEEKSQATVTPPPRCYVIIITAWRVFPDTTRPRPVSGLDSSASKYRGEKEREGTRKPTSDGF